MNLKELELSERIAKIEITLALKEEIPNSGYKIVPDATQPDTFDITVTVTDKAKITKDGAVVGGNKIKIGLPITLEGKTYKLTGTVSDIKIED